MSSSGNKRKLGSWFPSASVIKPAGKGLTYEEGSEISLLLFYHYVQPQWNEGQKAKAIAFVEKQGASLTLGGRCRVACEGFNATISGSYNDVRKFSEGLIEFEADFKRADFKYIDELKPDRAFKDLKVLPVKELVFYGIDNQHTLGMGGTHLEPKEYHQKLSEAGEDTVVIDVRNGYEYDIGRFEGQEAVGGAELLNPEMRKSTDFPDWINKEETKKKLEGKQVLMYCTGGVRCERASALLQREYGDKLKGVYQLQGGIEKYMQEYTDGGFWRGKNFVFDKREAFDAANKQGVGGVIEKSASESKNGKKNKKQKTNEEGQGQGLLGRCCACNNPWDRYIGKKKCKTCEVPVLICEECCTKGVAKGNDKDTVLKIRCPLCVKDGCTVPASELSMTDNGRRSDNKAAAGGSTDGAGVASRTVLQWGGGKGKKTEKKKKEKSRDLSNIPCKFAAECQRKDCWFWHPSV
jgi:predicted sulfurtransferase